MEIVYFNFKDNVISYLKEYIWYYNCVLNRQ